jgi:hypothetical protein
MDEETGVYYYCNEHRFKVPNPSRRQSGKQRRLAGTLRFPGGDDKGGADGGESTTTR